MPRKHKYPTKALNEYPQGTFIKSEKGYFYVLSSARRLRFTSTRVLDSWAPQRIVEVSESDAAVSKMRVAGKMKFRNGSLLYCQADGKMYLVSDNKIRHIRSPDILSGLNMRRQDAVWVSYDETQLHEEGVPLD